MDFAEKLEHRLREKAIKGVQNAGFWLTTQLKRDVNFSCPEYHGREGGHSPLGGAPYRESEEGMDSIQSRDITNGVEVGVTATSNNRLQDPRFGQNQLAYWDQKGRPWFKGDDGKLWQRKYSEGFNREVGDTLKR